MNVIRTKVKIVLIKVYYSIGIIKYYYSLI